MTERDIDIAVADEIQVIRFTRPDKKNAFTGAMYDAMSAALDRGDRMTASSRMSSSARAACSMPATTSTISSAVRRARRRARASRRHR